MFYISKMPDNQDHYRKVESDTLFQFWLSSQQVNVYRQISNSLYFNYIQQKQTEDFVTHTQTHKICHHVHLSEWMQNHR